MPGTEPIYKWLIEKTFSSLDYRNRSIEIGPPDLQMITNPEINPLVYKSYPFALTLQNRTSFKSDLRFGVKAGSESWIGIDFVKKIEHTPFYYSKISNAFCTIHLVDYYNWENNPEVYRLVLVQQHTRFGFIITFPESKTSIFPQGNTFRFGEFYLGLSDETCWRMESNDLSLNSGPNHETDWAFLIKFSLTRFKAEGLTVEQGFRQLVSLSDYAAEGHIQHHVILNNRDAEIELDDLWCRQNTIEPGWKLTPSVRKNPFTHEDTFLVWVVEIGIYFHHRELLTDLYLALKPFFERQVCSSRTVVLMFRLEHFLNIAEGEKLISSAFLKYYSNKEKEASADPFFTCLHHAENPVSDRPDLTDEQIIYVSFFTSAIADKVTIRALQRYWDHLSLPLFSNQCFYASVQDQEKLVIVYLFALFQGLPFAEELSEMVKHLLTFPLLRLLVFLQQRIQKRYITGQCCYFKSGPEWDYTRKKIILSDRREIQFHKFGETYFTKYGWQGTEVFRIDKLVLCGIDRVCTKLAVHPDVPFYPLDNPSDTRIEIQAGDRALSLPLLWAKGQVHLNGFRFRWIFKKTRYQITIQKQRKQISSLTIDNEFIEFTRNQRIIHYIERKHTEPDAYLMVLDAKSRNLHWSEKHASRSVILVGWIKNHHNQFVELFSYGYGKRQHPLQLSQKNRYRILLDIPADSRELLVYTKRMKRPLILNSVEDSFLDKLYQYPASAGRGQFVVLIDPGLKEHLEKIKDFFFRYFAFNPVCIMTAERCLPVVCTVLIHLSEHHEDLQVRTDKKITFSSYLQVGTMRSHGDLTGLTTWLDEKFNGLTRMRD